MNCTVVGRSFCKSEWRKHWQNLELIRIQACSTRSYSGKVVEIGKSNIKKYIYIYPKLMVKQLGDRTTVVQSLQSPFRLHEPPSAEQQGGCKKIAMFIQNKLNKCLRLFQ